MGSAPNRPPAKTHWEREFAMNRSICDISLLGFGGTKLHKASDNWFIL